MTDHSTTAPHCDQCKYWDTDDTYSQIPGSSIRICIQIPMFWDVTDWDEDANRVLKPEYANQKAFAQDGSDYSARLFTRADFFCAHFEPASSIDTSRQ